MIICIRYLLCIFFREITKTNSNDKIFDKVILIIINSSAPVSVTARQLCGLLHDSKKKPLT